MRQTFYGTRKNEYGRAKLALDLSAGIHTALRFFQLSEAIAEAMACA